MAFVTVTGLKIKTIEEILEELSAQQKADLDSTLNTSPDEPIGQLNGIFAAQLREIWEVAQVAYDGFNPDAVEGFLQEKLSALTGTLRKGATKGTTSLDCDLDIATTLTAGTSFANVVGDPDNRWTPVADFTAPVGGVQAVPFEAEFAGAVIANAATITTISTPVVGWNSVTNPIDATVGTEIETPSELRQRREEELRATGSATLDAVRADVLTDAAVLQVSVFENTSNVTDPATGLPGKAIEVVVFDGSPPVLTDDQIAQLIFDTKAAGMLAFGTSSGIATDSIGGFHTIGFSRPTEREIWIELDISIDISSGYSGEDALKAALVLLNDTDLLQGRDVIAQRLNEVAMTFDGVFDVTATRLGFAVSPVGTTNLTIGPRELARLDTARILITELIIPIP